MSHEDRLRAQQQLADLLEMLRQHPDRDDAAPLVELGEQLDRAIASFHMEAIRFHMYTLGRRLSAPGASVPQEAHALYDAIRVSLDAAGFHTRSVTG